ncbi:MAG: hypothetical protein K2R98_14380 [Gemmataceae bacterium]|nr:hypothetical protein [Gemmataceae bacterium]
MPNFKCPQCAFDMNGEAGQLVRCPGCGQTVTVPKGGMSTTTIVLIVAAALIVPGCLCGVISLVAITAIGTKSTLTFQTVGSSLTASGK